uniref:Uncharacterized protein n=1 Tax=Acrobeloides nanus TaxID=290746 RepID=A0A914CDZ5_9BILA
MSIFKKFSKVVKDTVPIDDMDFDERSRPKISITKGRKDGSLSGLDSEKTYHHDFYNDFGDLFNPNIGSNWKPKSPLVAKRNFSN